MDLSFIADYVSPIALVICLAIGYIIKNAIPNDGINRFIPLIVAVIGVIVCAFAEGTFTVQILAMGLISGLASTGLYEAFKNIITGTKEGTE